MYQPYPSGNQPTSPAQRPQPPRAVRNAALFMYAGAVLSVISGVVTVLSYHAAGRRAYPRLTPRQVHALAGGEIVVSIVYTVVVVALWLVIAWASQQGRSWARIVGTVLFGVNTVLLVLNVIARASTGIVASPGLASVPVLLVWLAGLGAIIMLWRRETSAYFASAGGS